MYCKSKIKGYICIKLNAKQKHKMKTSYTMTTLSTTTFFNYKSSEKNETGILSIDSLREKCAIVNSIVSEMDCALFFEDFSIEKQEEIFNQYSFKRVYDDEKKEFFTSYDARVLDISRKYGYWVIANGTLLQFHSTTHMVEMSLNSDLSVTFTLHAK